MYDMIFKADSGKTFVFGRSGSNVFYADIGNGVSVRLGTSQGFSQVGESVDTQSVPGRPINVRGVLYGSDLPALKQALRSAVAPFSSGRLIIDGRYFIAVNVDKAPTMAPDRHDGKFSLRFFAPFPFFYSVEETTSLIGQMTPEFSFPVNYATSHQFGVRSPIRTANIINTGDVNAPFRLTLQAFGPSTNVTLTDILTQRKLRLSGSLSAGDEVQVYRDAQNILRAELTTGGEKQDIIGRIDEASDLFELRVGDNVVTVSDDEGGVNLTAWFSFHPAVGAVYES